MFSDYTHGTPLVTVHSVKWLRYCSDWHDTYSWSHSLIYVLIDDGVAPAAATLSSRFGDVVCGTPWTGCWMDPRAGVDAVLLLAGTIQRLAPCWLTELCRCESGRTSPRASSRVGSPCRNGIVPRLGYSSWTKDGTVFLSVEKHAPSDTASDPRRLVSASSWSSWSSTLLWEPQLS